MQQVDVRIYDSIVLENDFPEYIYPYLTVQLSCAVSKYLPSSGNWA